MSVFLHLRPSCIPVLFPRAVYHRRAGQRSAL